MSMSENLIEKRSALLAEAQELVSLAEAEGRDLTADEDEKVAASLRSAADLDATIKMHQDLEARSREAAELRKNTAVVLKRQSFDSMGKKASTAAVAITCIVSCSGS